MELDDLKNTWQQTGNNKIKNTDIMELIQHKSYGPITALKNAFRKQIIVMMLIPALLLFTSIDDITKALSSIMFWSYVVFCIGVIVSFYYNYRVVNKMEAMDGMVKQNLEQQIAVLEKRFRWHLTGVRIALIFFILLTEIVPYFQHYRMLDKWHSAPLLLRYAVYALLLIVQYTLSMTVWNRKFGSHLKYLKALVKEMQ
jgi:Mn2+/Fe2+ NRAMP family transporter